MVIQHMKEEWKFVSIMFGELSALIIITDTYIIFKIPELFVVNLDFGLLVSQCKK